MYRWKTSKKRKKHQRALNKLVRDLNKSMAEDSLWRGRFFIRQGRSSIINYEDGSGATLGVELIFCDKKTGLFWRRCETSNVWCHLCGYHIWEDMNKFITEICDVWRTEDPRLDIYDWVIDKEKRSKIVW